MSAIDERNYFTRSDRKFRLQYILNKIKFAKPVLIYLLYLFFRIFKVGKSNTTKKLVIISLSRLGDTVFTIPAIRLIIRNYQNYKITLVCFPESLPIYRIDLTDLEIVTLDKKNFYFGRRIANSSVRKYIKHLKPEIIFDLTSSISSATMIFSSKAQIVAGTNLEYFKSIYTHFSKPRVSPRFIDIYLDVVNLVLEFNRNSELYAFKSVIETQKTILIHPFAIRKAKEWNIEKFILLTTQLQKMYRVALVSPDGFINGKMFERITELNIEVFFTPSITELINVIKESSVFICNDSGPVYIAALLGKPTFTIYGPTNPLYSHPVGDHHRYFWNKIKCTAGSEEMVCSALGGIDCSHHNCLNEVSVEELLGSINDFLQFLDIEKIEQI